MSKTVEMSSSTNVALMGMFDSQVNNYITLYTQNIRLTKYLKAIESWL